MKIISTKNIAATLSFLFLVAPVVVYGAGLIPCGDTPYVDGSDPLTTSTHPCGFNDLLLVVNNVISFLIYTVAVPLAALGFMWTGGNLVLNQNKESAWSDAKGRFWDIGVGFAIILGAYVLIKMVLFAFLNTDAGFGTFLLD